MARLEPLAERSAAQQGEMLLDVDDLKVHFSRRRGIRKGNEQAIRAVDGVSFSLVAGETFSLVGESGCGKSTVAQSLVGLLRPTAGRVVYKGTDLASASRDELRMLRRDIQIVFQDPYASLDPRMRVRDLLMEPLRVQGIRCPPRYAEELLELVGLDARYVNRFAHEFSGGQCQRIGIARALALRPSVLVLDEPIASLDVSIQAQIMNLLMDLQDEFQLAYLLISHDVSVVQMVSHQVGVMYLGQIVEAGPRVLDDPVHPYSKALLSAVPSADPRARDGEAGAFLEGEVPSPANPPSGCRFRTRCPMAAPRCAEEVPDLIDRTGDGRLSACHFVTRQVPEKVVT
jgi:peptide/nickel transport system ATP-binding protein/oligopeptide transport system ATP-binding protein